MQPNFDAPVMSEEDAERGALIGDAQSAADTLCTNLDDAMACDTLSDSQFAKLEAAQAQAEAIRASLATL